MADPRPRLLAESLIVRYQQDPVFHRLVHILHVCLREGAWTQHDLLDACEVAEALWTQHHPAAAAFAPTAEKQAAMDAYHQQLAHAMTTTPVAPIREP
jgi:hypothetical protein